MYKGEKYYFQKGRHEPTDYYNKPGLWITNPNQRNKNGAIFVGGFPDEWIIPYESLPPKIQEDILQQAGGELYYDEDFLSQ